MPYAPAARPPSTPVPTCVGHFAWVPFLAFAASVVFEGVRVVLTERLLGQV